MWPLPPADRGERRRNGEYTSQERDVLAFAEQWTLAGRVDEAVVDRLKKSLSAAELVLLAATVSQANWACRFNNVFGVELP